MIGIIAAMDKELNALIERVEDARSETVSGIRFTKGTLDRTPVVCAVCGIGKVNAAVCAQTMILRYGPDVLINTGVGGALSPSLKVCDVVLGEYAVQHDVDTSALGDPVCMVSTVNVVRFPMDEGTVSALEECMKEMELKPLRAGIATGDRFVSEEADKRRIRDLTSCSVCEMEGAAIAQVCYLNHVKCAVLRSVSDGADDGAPMSYLEFADKAAHINVEVLTRYLKSLSENC